MDPPPRTMVDQSRNSQRGSRDNSATNQITPKSNVARTIQAALMGMGEERVELGGNDRGDAGGGGGGGAGTGTARRETGRIVGIAVVGDVNVVRYAAGQQGVGNGPARIRP